MRIMHVWALVGMTILVLFLSEEASFAYHLQAEIDNAEKGEVIHIPSGVYEGSFIIDKPVTLIGDGEVAIVNKSGDYALFIKSDDVHVHNLTIVHENDQLDLSAVRIEGNRNVLSDITLHTNGMGIVLNAANQNILRNLSIEGAFRDSEFTGSMLTREGNGIDLFRSNENVIENVKIQYVQDGVYIEQSEKNTIRDSYVAHSRYGFHFMFTKRSHVLNNISEHNIAGAMVMGTIGTNLQNNQFRKQSFHVHSQGLMLYDVHHATVLNNVLEENLTGLYIESSTNNQIHGNVVYANYIGLNVVRSQDNQISYNDFINNQISARAKDSYENIVRHNFWDEYKGLDITGEKISAIPYHADLIFPSIVTNKPAFQLFADSPGLMFLQFVLDVDRTQTLTDEAPLMNASQLLASVRFEMKRSDMVIYSFAMIISLILMYVGGRKS